jgi:hypothetical protein
MGEEISKSYGRAAESISKSGQHISQSAAFKGISQVCIHFDQCNVGIYHILYIFIQLVNNY